MIDLSVSSAVWNHSAAVTGALASAIVKSATGFLTPDASYSFCAFLNSDPNGLAAYESVGLSCIALLAHSILSFVIPTALAPHTTAFLKALVAESAAFENPFAMSDSDAILLCG